MFYLINGKKGETMDKTFHPVSGEVVYTITEAEKEIIDIALQQLLLSEYTISPSECGVING